MNRVVPPLHESHASIYLQEAFEKALEAFDQWSLGRDEPIVRLDDKDVPISSIFGRMRTSDDIMPERMRMLAQSLLGRPLDNGTFAETARQLRQLTIERLRHDAGENTDADRP